MSNDMEHEIRRCTAYVVGRNCYFAGLAIIMMALSFADKPAYALDIAGILNFVMTAILLLLAVNAAGWDYRRSETYALLSERGIQAPPTIAAMTFAKARRDTCLHFARYAAAAASLFLAMGLLWAFIHPSDDPMNSGGLLDVPHVMQQPPVQAN
jgi:hypothetical protein